MRLEKNIWACNSVGECHPCKVEVEGSNPSKSMTQSGSSEEEHLAYNQKVEVS